MILQGLFAIIGIAAIIFGSLAILFAIAGLKWASETRKQELGANPPNDGR